MTKETQEILEEERNESMTIDTGESRDWKDIRDTQNKGKDIKTNKVYHKNKEKRLNKT